MRLHFTYIKSFRYKGRNVIDVSCILSVITMNKMATEEN